MDNSFASYKVEERSYVSYIKREIHNQLVGRKFTETHTGKIDIIVSEITSNLIKHAGSGELLFRIYNDDDSATVFEIISIDNGPGIADTARMMRDGVSSAGTLGNGLGAIGRLSEVAQLYSIPGWGTVLYVMVSTRKKAALRKKSALEIRALCVNKPREVVCGDGYRVKATGSDVSILFGDGLGHGPKAKEAMDRASDFFLASATSDPVEIIQLMHENIRRTRGLVATVAIFDLASNDWKVCGVGNILTKVYSGIQFRDYVPYNGTIGMNLPSSMSASVLAAEANQYLIMSSDGIQSRWDINRYPSIRRYDNIVLAAAIYKDFTRGNDDASVFIAKVT